jgi:hypothetical protein
MPTRAGTTNPCFFTSQIICCLVLAFQRQMLKGTVREAKTKFCRNSLSLSLSLCSSFSTVPSSVDSSPQLPPFDYQPKPYEGRALADETLQKRKYFFGFLSLFTSTKSLSVPSFLSLIKKLFANVVKIIFFKKLLFLFFY